MVLEGHWLLPTMNGHLRLAKPPLPTWLTALSGLVGGDIEYIPALRLPAALMALALVFFTFLLARQLSRDRLIPFLAALVLATSLAFVQAGRQGTWDIYCHSFMTGAIWLFVRGWRRPPAAYGHFAGAGMLLACSFLSKGPVAFYALLLPFLLAWWRAYGRQAFQNRKKEILVALLVGLLFSLAWPAYVFIKVPLALSASASQESTAWLERHVKPFWFYATFPVETGIWTLFAAAALVPAYARPRISPWGNYRLLATWVFLSVLLLSVIPEKKERYLLPVLVPLALLTGHYLRYLIAAFAEKKYTRTDYGLAAATSVLLVLVTAASPYLLYRFVYLSRYYTSVQFVAASAWILLLGAGIVFFFQKGRMRAWVLVLAVLQVTVYVLGGSPFYRRKHTNKQYKSLREVRQLAAVRHLPFYALGGMPPEQVWEVGQTVDSFRVEAPFSGRSGQLPAALFAMAPLDSGAIRAQQMDFREVRRFHYRKDDPAAVYYVYILTPAKAPQRRTSTP
jgi:4-amino-4-deoxy-L-arabinose transferase-like glycosyltransferase